MENIKKRNQLIANISSVCVFLAIYIVCGIIGWVEVMGSMFPTSGENSGMTFETPTAYVVVCLLFFAISFALIIFGMKLKNKLMVLLPVCYEVMLIISIFLLGAFATGGITNETLNTIVMYVVLVLIIPAYGIMWSLPLIVAILIVVALLILSVIGLVKVFKKDNK